MVSANYMLDFIVELSYTMHDTGGLMKEVHLTKFQFQVTVVRPMKNVALDSFPNEFLVNSVRRACHK